MLDTAKHEQRDDGIFHMDIDDFKKSFYLTFTSPDVKNWHHSYFLSLDREIGETGTHVYCGPRCSKNNFTVYSPVDQLVYVSGHVHPGRTYVEKSCIRNCVSCATRHVLKTSKYPHHEFLFSSGSQWLTPIMMKAGTTMDLSLEVDFSRMDITKDFSIVMWSEKEATTITHDDGHESDSYPMYDPPVEEEPEE